PAWPVYLDTNRNGSHDEGERLIHTNIQGHYQFVVEAGQYQVTTLQLPGWNSIFPDDGLHAVTVEPGQAIKAINFGQGRSEGTLHGTVWADHNGDGQRQAVEPGLPAWPVYLDTNRNGSHDRGERLIHTSRNGHYHFVVEAGQYRVAVLRLPGWNQSFPEQGSHDVTLETGQTVQGLDFGQDQSRAFLHGVVWNDRDGDGQRQEKEHGIPGWPVYLDENGNGSHDSGERLTHTDFSGRYRFVVQVGEHEVAQGSRLGWQATFPGAGSHRVTVESGQHVEGLAFGNQSQAGSLHGVVWNDLNGDGQRQEKEPGMPGWPVYLDGNQNGSHDQGERLVHTNLHGHYGFVVEAGQYQVVQGSRRGWQGTAPENNSFTVDVEAGQHLEGLAFGNQSQFGSLHGSVWYDRNGNGERDHRELGMLGWIVYLDANNNGTREANEQAVRTGSHGNYHFHHVEPGEHVVREMKRPGWQQTAPDEGYHQVVMEPGGVVEEIHFGNRLLPRDRPHARFSMKIIDDTGQVVNKLMRGERFSVETYVEDLRESPEGIRSAELDIVFDDQLATVTGPPEFVDEFDQERTGESSEGVLDNVGARAANGRTESGPVKLAKLRFRAMQAGEVNFDSLPAHESLTATHLLGDDHGLSSELIDFLGASIEVVANPYVNLVQVHDVDHDQHIAPKDALVLINQLNQRGARKLPRPGEGDAGNAGFFIDVNMDGYHTPIDVMWVINDLNRNGIRTISSSGGEGESLEMPVGGLIAGNALVARLPRDIQVQRVDRSSDLETISDPLLNAVHQLAVVRDLPARAQYSEDDGDDSAFQHDDLWNWGHAVVDDLLG
ncbi:MAG: SdrD B-like domain-containing protein, partial [Pirellulaceae bacterium]